MGNDRRKPDTHDLVLWVIYSIAIAVVLLDLFIWRPN